MSTWSWRFFTRSKIARRPPFTYSITTQSCVVGPVPGYPHLPDKDFDVLNALAVSQFRQRHEHWLVVDRVVHWPVEPAPNAGQLGTKRLRIEHSQVNQNVVPNLQASVAEPGEQEQNKFALVDFAADVNGPVPDVPAPVSQEISQPGQAVCSPLPDQVPSRGQAPLSGLA